jgi:hypothetical protein
MRLSTGRIKSLINRRRNKLAFFLKIQFIKLKSWYIRKWVLSPQWIWPQMIKRKKLPKVNWPKFERSNKGKLKRLISNLEKISKISALRLEKDYTDSVIDDLQWIEDSFIAVLKLHDKNKLLFLSLIDPENRFKIITSNITDWNDVLFSDLGNFFSISEDQPVRKSYEKLYKSFPNPTKGNDLILRYISTIFSIWNAAGKKENFLVQKYSLYVFSNWIHVIDPLNDANFNYQSVLKYFLDNLYVLNTSTLEEQSNKQFFLSDLLSYNIYLNKIFSEDVNEDNIDVYFEYLFRNLHLVISRQKFTIAKSFIERCTDSMFYPSGNDYSKLYSLLSSKMDDAGILDYAALLKPIPNLCFYKIRYIKSFEELQKWSADLDRFIETEIADKIELDENIKQQVLQNKNFALRQLKFNRLQVLLVKVSAYALFKSDVSILNHAFEYNQPKDSGAIQGNKEIMPTTLLEILNLMTYRYVLEHELLGYWEGHHGIEYYVDQIFLILLYRYNRKKMYFEEDPKRLTESFCIEYLNGDPGSIDGLKYYLEKLKDMFTRLSASPEYKGRYFPNDRKIVETVALLPQILAGISSVMENIEETGLLKEETKNNFLSKVINEYQKYNFLYRLFEYYGEVEYKIAGKFERIGINELMDRTAFVENWHIPYVGFIENRGKDIAEQENRIGQFSLLKRIPLENRLKVNSKDIIVKLKKHCDKNTIIVGRNLNFDYLLQEYDGYRPAWKDSPEKVLIPNFHVGYFDQIPVYNLYDNLFHDSFFVLKKLDIIKVTEKAEEQQVPFTLIKHFKTSFIDFGNDVDNLNSFLKAPPSWISEEFQDNELELRSFAKKKVWIRILKQTSFELKRDKSNYLFELNA